MATKTLTFTDSDLAYLRSTFKTLEEICADRSETPDDIRSLIAEGKLPRPSYVLDEGTELVWPDYFALADAAGGVDGLRDEYERQYAAALEKYGLEFDAALMERRWKSYMEGISGICLREVNPETGVRKRLLIDRIERLTADPRPGDKRWAAELRRHVDDLDALEKEFAPDYDRARFVPTRDTYIRDVRRAFPQLWA
jgi:Family of unknown function (DUF6058)